MKTSIKLLSRLFLAAALGLCLTASSAQALDPLIDMHYNADLAAGSVSYGGGGLPGDGILTGVDLPIALITAINVPLNSGAPYAGFTPTALLSFATGSLLSYTPLGGGVYNWIFAPGGPISVVDPDTGGQVLLTGTLAGPLTVNEINRAITLSGTFTDEKGERLAAFYDVDTDGWHGTIGMSFTRGDLLPPMIDMEVTGATLDIEVHNIQSAAIPEPSTMLLLGSGLVGMIVLGIRRGKRS